MRRSPRLQASMRSERQGWMTCSTQVNYRGIVIRVEPKTLIGSAQNGMQSGTPSRGWCPRTKKTAGVMVGAKSSMSSQSNIANPTSRLRVEAGASARNADGMAGKGCWKKRRPLCNGADRDCNIVPPCKRADFQRVVRDERTRRTFMGGNCK